MEEKEELFRTVEYKLTYKGENIESENHYFATIMVLIALSKNCQCILKLVGEGLIKNMHGFKVSPTNHCLIAVQIREK